MGKARRPITASPLSLNHSTPRHPTGQIPEDPIEAHEPRRDFNRAVHRIIDGRLLTLAPPLSACKGVHVVAVEVKGVHVNLTGPDWGFFAHNAAYFAFEFRPSGIRGVQAVVSPRFKEYGESQVLRALYFSCLHCRLNRLFYLCSESFSPPAATPAIILAPAPAPAPAAAPAARSSESNVPTDKCFWLLSAPAFGPYAQSVLSRS